MKKSSMLQNVTMGMLDILCVLSTIACTRAWYFVVSIKDMSILHQQRY
jgi:hypothetical protein